MKRLISKGCLSLSLLGLSACSWVAVLDKKSIVFVPERSGSQSFTLVGDVPAQFGLGVTAWYGPADDTQLHCQDIDLYSGRLKPRIITKGFDIPITPRANVQRRQIPLTHYIGECELILGRVVLETTGRFGDKSWQEAYNKTNFYLRAQLPGGEPDFDRNGVRAVNRYCTWLFGESMMRNKELKKSLSCEGERTGYLERANLSGKFLRLMVELNPEEAPSSEQSWIKVQEGWKPCTPKAAGGKRCQQPIIFRTFQMNGQTCTVYPGCTEYHG